MDMQYRGLRGEIYNVDTQKLAGGGEGSIHNVIGNDLLVAKIFRPDKRNHEREEKLCYMVQNPMTKEQLSYITWPLDVLYDMNGFAGYIMQKVNNMQSLTALYSEEKYDLRYRLLAAYNVCVAIDAIHEAGQICGDLNPQNILINLDSSDEINAFHVTLVDVDSYHVVTPTKTYRCEVGLPDYLAPEIQNKMVNGVTLRNASLPTYTQETDLFALAVHIFCLLMNGCHPFACAKRVNGNLYDTMGQMRENSNRNSVVAPQPIDNIKVGYFPFFHHKDNITVPVYAPLFDDLPEDIRLLFIKTFVEGYKKPEQRATTDEWIQVLKSYVLQTRSDYSLLSCGKGHYYFKVGRDCPFCNIDQKIRIMLSSQNAPIINDKIEEFHSTEHSDVSTLRENNRVNVVTDESPMFYNSGQNIDTGKNRKNILDQYSLIAIIIGATVIILILVIKFNMNSESYPNDLKQTTAPIETYEPAYSEDNNTQDSDIKSDMESENNENDIQSDINLKENKKKKSAKKEKNTDYIIPESSSRKLTKKDVKGKSARQLRIARNEIYARHGRLFVDQELQDYFDSKDWYLGYIEPEDFVETEELSKLERRNALFIRKFE